ncbi:MAG: hypothetical protein Kow0040_01800 [Thermogutta sp.]
MIRPIVPDRLADFDEQVWPVNLAIVIFAAFTAGVIYATTDDFWDPRLLYNGFFRLSVVAVLVAGLFWATALLRGRAARRVQFCVIISLLLHMVLAVMLREQYLRLVAQRQADEVGAEAEEERVILREYFSARTDAEGAPSEYERPIETESPQASPETALAPPTTPAAPAPDPTRDRDNVAETPPHPQAAPTPRAELAAPHRMEMPTRPAERQVFEHQPQADQPLAASPVRPNPAPPARQPQPAPSEVARQEPSRDFQSRTPLREPDDRPRPEPSGAGRLARSEMNPDVVPTAPSTRPSPSVSPSVTPRAEAVPAVTAAAPRRNLADSLSPPQRASQSGPIRASATQEAQSALDSVSSSAASAAARRAESLELEPVAELAATARASTTRSLPAEAAQAIPGVRPQSRERTEPSPSAAVSSTRRMDFASPLREAGADLAEAPAANLTPQTFGRRVPGEDRGAAPLSAGIPAERSPNAESGSGAGLPIAAAESPRSSAASNVRSIDSSPGLVSRDAGSPRLATPGAASSNSGSDAPLVSLSVPAATSRATARRGEAAATEGVVALGEAGLRATGRARLNAPGTPGMTARAEPAATAQAGGIGGGGTGGQRTQPNESALAVAGGGTSPQVRGGSGGDSPLDIMTAGRSGGSEGDQVSGIGIRLPEGMGALRGSGENEGGFSGVFGNPGVATGQRRGLDSAAALSGVMAGAAGAESVVARSGDAAGGAHGATSSLEGMSDGAAGLDVPFGGIASGAPIRGGGASGIEAAPESNSAAAALGVFGREAGPLRIPGGGEADPMAALPVGSGPVRRGQVTPGLPPSLGPGPAEETTIAGLAGDDSGGGAEPAASGLMAVRREGGLPVLRSDSLGDGGVGGPPSLRVGLPGRFSRPESDVVQDSASRFAAVRRTVPIPSALADTAPLEPAEAFMQRSPTQRGQRAAELGGGPETEEAVERALAFLARLQFSDGHWSLHAIPAESQLDPNAFASGTMRGDTAATGLVLLAFLGAGYTHTDGKYQEVVQRGLKWLLARRQSDGRLYSAAADPDPFTRFYGHGLAAIALCEAYGMTRDPALREPAEKAVDFIVQSQHPEYGGWRYEPRRESDTSVTGWQLMALKSAEMSGLNVPRPVLEKVTRWLDLAQTENGARYMYNPHAGETPSQIHGRVPNRAMTAEGLLMRIYLGWDRTHPPLVQGAEFIRSQLPDFGTPQYRLRDAYYWYYATQVMFQMQRDYWRDWNDRIRPMLLESQIRQGDFDGSWDPLKPVPDRWAEQAGRIYVTAVHALILEVYYRHLPLFKTLKAER